MEPSKVIFFVLAGILLSSSLLVVLHRNPVKSALFLVVYFASLAGFYAYFSAGLVALAQILVYVGAIMVLFLFVIMLIAIREKNFENLGSKWAKTTLVAILSIFLLGNIAYFLHAGFSVGLRADPFAYSIAITPNKILREQGEVFSFIFFERYILPFEMISILLLIGMIGAIMLAKRNPEKQE